MKWGRLADFLLIGLAVLPAALLFGDAPGLALLLFVPLLLAACLSGMAEQVNDNRAGADPAPRIRRAVKRPRISAN